MGGGCEVYKKIKTDRCEVEVRRGCGPDEIRRFKLDTGFGFFLNPAAGVEPLAKAAERGDYVALAVHDSTVIGFLVAYRFGAEGLPSRVMLDFVYDIATEVSRKWRQRGLGKALLEAAVTDPFFDDKVLIIRGNPSYWDCYGSACRKYALFIMEIPVMYYGFEKLPVKLPGDLFTIARIGPKARVTRDELIGLLAKIEEGVSGEFYDYI